MARNLSVGAKFVHRKLGRVIEDFLVPEEGESFIANPGEGLGAEMSFYDYTPVGAPKVKREQRLVRAEQPQAVQPGLAVHDQLRVAAPGRQL